MSKKPRSRFGCEACRAKRVKCDESKPRCSRCAEKNISCNYKIILQFREDLEDKGRKFGREGVWSKTGGSKKATSGSNALITKSKSSHYERIKRSQLRFINTIFHDFHSPKIGFSLQPSIIPRDIMSSIDGDISSLSFALNYYISFISPILNPLGSETVYFNLMNNNKYVVIEKGLDLSALIQYAQQEQHLFYLILSLGSIYLSRLVSGEASQEWVSKARELQQMAINASGRFIGGAMIAGPGKPAIEDLGDDYETASNYSHGTIQDQLTPQRHSAPPPNSQSLLTYVLLILYELANDCSPQWSAYLKESKKLIDDDDFKLPHNSLELSLLKFGLEFLDYHEAIGRTACKDTNSFFLKYDDEETATASDSSAPVKLLSWIGCDRNLLSILQDITDLSFEKDNPNFSESNFNMICEGVRNRIESQNLHFLDPLLEIADSKETANTKSFMDSRLELMISDHENPEEFCFLLACELKRMATLVYFECCLLDKTPEDSFVTKAVKVIFKVLEVLVLKHEFKWYSTMLWTVYIASCEISHLSEDCEELRYLSLQIMDKIEGQSLGNVNRTRNFILKSWKKRDLQDADENSHGYIKKAKADKKSLKYTNDWDRYVVDRNVQLSMG